MSDTSSSVLLLIDVPGIQSFIFRSNRLRENVGASFLVQTATTEWVKEELIRAFGASRVATRSKDEPERTLIVDDLDAELVYAAGGNALLLMRSIEHARRLCAALSLRLLTHARGLELEAASVSFDPLADVLAERLSALHQQLATARRERIGSEPLLGLSVTERCLSTGLPAVGTAHAQGPRDSAQPASAEVLAKVGAAHDARARLKDSFGEQARASIDGYEVTFAFPDSFEDLPRARGESSFTAVVHADGNGMGQKFRDLHERFGAGAFRAHVDALRALSDGVALSARLALTDTIADLAASVTRYPGGWEIVSDVPSIPSLVLEEDAEGRPILPLLPLVFGGDDVTFVCDGRLALDLTARYLRAFEKQTDNLSQAISQDLAGVTASAGVVIVKSKYPFAQAYAAADTLAASAKRHRVGTERGSTLDWHVTTEGLPDDLTATRTHAYHTADGMLLLRPVTLVTEDTDGHRSWSWIEQAVRRFQDGEAWSGRRNKTKRLRDALREGPNAVAELVGQLAAWDESTGAPDSPNLTLLPEPPEGVRPASKAGFAFDGEDNDVRALYFDALELADLHLRLDPLPHASA